MYFLNKLKALVSPYKPLKKIHLKDVFDEKKDYVEP